MNVSVSLWQLANPHSLKFAGGIGAIRHYSQCCDSYNCYYVFRLRLFEISDRYNTSSALLNYSVGSSRTQLRDIVLSPDILTEFKPC